VTMPITASNPAEELVDAAALFVAPLEQGNEFFQAMEKLPCISDRCRGSRTPRSRISSSTKYISAAPSASSKASCCGREGTGGRLRPSECLQAAGRYDAAASCAPPCRSACPLNRPGDRSGANRQPNLGHTPPKALMPPRSFQSHRRSCVFRQRASGSCSVVSVGRP
jgi:hypothetical protein